MMGQARHMRRRVLIVCTALLFFSLPIAAAWADILIIANPQAEISSLDQQQLKSIYLQRSSTWPNGLKIQLVMLTEDGPPQEFCQQFLGKSASQLERHWRRQLYTGKALPPAEFTTSSAVLNYIRATPGALGFIAAQPRPQGVVVITITP